jgi:hypothetical protein
VDFKHTMDVVSRGFEIEIDGGAPWRRWRLMAPGPPPGPPPPDHRNDTG